jgi:dihydrofolate reductase
VTAVAIIVAADEQGGIGLKGRLPWHLPDDLRRFKALTMGKPLVMGRKTYESIGRPLSGRHNIVISRQAGLEIAGCTVAGSLEAALAAAEAVPAVFVIGGAEIYRLALPCADVVYLTRVHASVGADTCFPELDSTQWEEASREDHPADERHAHAFSFLTFRRKR